MKIARFDKRIFGWIFDEIIPIALGLVFIVICMSYNIMTSSWLLKTICGCLVSYFIYIFLCTLVLLISNGFTIGGIIVGIRIIHTNGNSLTFSECLLKSITTGIIPYTIINAIYMIAVHTERSVFDRLTNTIVAEYRHAKD